VLIKIKSEENKNLKKNIFELGLVLLNTRIENAKIFEAI
jgi:hypothetical protein